MGSWSARITAADFVTPPELAGLALAAEPAGRLGGVRMELLGTAAGTRLGRAYQQVPLRLLPPFDFGPAQPALLYLLNPTAGLFDGDGHLVQINARAGSRAVVVGQSATRIHPSLGGFCTQQWEVRVESGAKLVVLPGPSIPFAGCRYYQRVNIHLAEGAHLFWGDIWLAGRHARGACAERFAFNTLVQDMTICRAGGLVFRDRFCWRGPWDADAADWHFSGAAACGSLFLTGRFSSDQGTAAFGADGAQFLTAFGDTCARWRGPSEAVITSLVHSALKTASGEDSIWLLSAGDLGPNHWFSHDPVIANS